MSRQPTRHTPPDFGDGKSNIPLLLIAAAFLCVTIILVLLQPNGKSYTTQVAHKTPGQAEPEQAEAATAQTNPTRREATEQPEFSTIDANQVSRSQFPLFAVSFTPLDRVTSAIIKEQLRQPIRLIDTGRETRDLPTLTSDVIGLMSPGNAPIDRRLQALLVDAIYQRQSDDYIRELINAAAIRDDLAIPTTLRTTKGGWDTYSLLKAMAQVAGGPVPDPAGAVETNGRQRIVDGDSLARIALRYYGQPLKYDIILAANPQIDPLNPVLTPGDYIQMPKP